MAQQQQRELLALVAVMAVIVVVIVLELMVMVMSELRRLAEDSCMTIACSAEIRRLMKTKTKR